MHVDGESALQQKPAKRRKQEKNEICFCLECFWSFTNSKKGKKKEKGGIEPATLNFKYPVH